jgi:hypothetical protein
MVLHGRSLSFVLLLVTAGTRLAHGQITGGINLPCSDDQVDIIATCLSRVFCAQPPSPIPAFDIGARSFAVCPNQPVDNFAQVQGVIGGGQAISTAQARALFFNRLIHKEIRGGDCQGNTSLLSLLMIRRAVTHHHRRHRLLPAARLRPTRSLRTIIPAIPVTVSL